MSTEMGENLAPNDFVPSPTRTRQRAIAAAIGSAGLIVVASYLTPDPRGLGTHEQLGLPPCISSNYLGVPCPLCGMTTAFALMAHVRPLDAFRTQPAGAVFFVLCVVTLADAIATAAHGRMPQHVAGAIQGRWVGATIGLAVLGAWLYKLIAFLG